MHTLLLRRPPSCLILSFSPRCRYNSNFPSELGLMRSRLSLDPNHNSPSHSNKSNRYEISRQEWDLRTGRAIYILTQTLPSFFSTGLISSPYDPSLSPFPSNIHSTSYSKREQTESPHGRLEDAQRTQNGKGRGKHDIASIYAPKIRLTYTPPVALPAPFPKTLRIEGIPLYMASSVFVRHTLNALYSDLHVELRRVNVLGPSSRGDGPTVPGEQGGTESPEGAGGESEGVGEAGRKEKHRDMSVFIGLCVRGTARVSGGLGEWDVNSTYTFSPHTGLIHLHTINSIYPAPHEAVYDALRTSLGRVFGLGGAGVGERVGIKGGEDGRA